MDKYAIPDYVTSRPRYYTGQFLRDDDFIDEQRYHISQMRRHERLLHVAGVVEGLAVTPAGALSVSVSAGSAVDSKGRAVVLGAAQVLSVPADGTFFVELRFSEVESDRADINSSVVANTRFSLEEAPLALVTASNRTPGAITLAQILAAGGSVSVVASSARVYAGVALPGPGGVSYALRARGDAAEGVAELGAGLSLTGDVTAVNGALSGAFKAASATLTGALSAAGATLSGALGAASANVSGALGAGSLSVAGALNAAGAAVSGALTAGSATLSGALNAGSAAVSGALTAGSATVTNALGAGSLNVTDALSAASGTITNALGVGSLSASGALGAASATLSGALSAASATLSGALGAASASISGSAGVGTASPKGKLHVAGDIAVGADTNNQKWFINPRAANGGDYLLIAGDLANGSMDSPNGIALRRGGSVGIGTVAPNARLDVAGNINYSQLTKLDVAESGSAVLRVSDFLMGAAARRGTPGRALVDFTTEVVLNWGPDWPTARVGSPLFVDGNLTLQNPTDKVDLLLNSRTRPTVCPAGGNVPANLAFQLRSAGAGELQLNQDNAGNVIMAIGGGNVGVAVAPTAKLHVYGVGPGGASIVCGTGIPGAVANAAGWSLVNALEARASSADAPPGVVFNHVGLATLGIVAQATPRGLRVTGPSNEPRAGLYVDDVVAANRFTCGNTVVLSDYQTFNPATNVLLQSTPWDRDAWIFRDQADSTGNTGIYHRQIDTALGALPGNSIAFIGNSALKSYISLITGAAYFAGEVTVRGTGRAVACNEESLRTIRGVVDPNGGVVSGAGFTVVRVALGVYDITFNTPFAAMPSIVTSQMVPGNINDPGGSSLDNVIVVGATNAKARLKCGNNGGGSADRYFHFIAVGP